MALEDGEAAAASAQFARQQLVVDVEDDVREEELGAWNGDERGNLHMMSARQLVIPPPPIPNSQLTK